MLSWKKNRFGYTHKPLEEGSTIVEVRMTMLEAFYECPYAFKFANNVKVATVSKENPYNKGSYIYRSGEIFQQGHVLHKVIYNYMVGRSLLMRLGKEGDELDEAMNPIIDEGKKFVDGFRGRFDVSSVNKSYLAFIKHAHIFDEYKYDEHLSEMPTSVMFEMGDLGIYLTGTPDHVLFHKETGEMLVVDIKTSKTKREDVMTEKGVKKYENRIQRRGYPLSVTFNITNKEFTGPYKFQYFPITKHVTPQVNTDFVIPNTTFEASEEFVLQLIESFASAYMNESYPTNKGCNRCWYCPLRTTKICPAWGGDKQVGF